MLHCGSWPLLSAATYSLDGRQNITWGSRAGIIIPWRLDTEYLISYCLRATKTGIERLPYRLSGGQRHFQIRWGVDYNQNDAQYDFAKGSHFAEKRRYCHPDIQKIN